MGKSDRLAHFEKLPTPIGHTFDGLGRRPKTGRAHRYSKSETFMNCRLFFRFINSPTRYAYRNNRLRILRLQPTERRAVKFSRKSSWSFSKCHCARHMTWEVRHQCHIILAETFLEHRVSISPTLLVVHRTILNGTKHGGAIYFRAQVTMHSGMMTSYRTDHGS